MVPQPIWETLDEKVVGEKETDGGEAGKMEPVCHPPFRSCTQPIHDFTIVCSLFAIELVLK